MSFHINKYISIFKKIFHFLLFDLISLNPVAVIGFILNLSDLILAVMHHVSYRSQGSITSDIKYITRNFHAKKS